MTSRALVLGGTGQIGHAAAESLREAGYDVTIAHRGQRSSRPPTQIRDIVLNREDTDALRAAVAGHQVVVDAVAYTTDHARQWAHVGRDIDSLIVISTGSVYQGLNGVHFGSGGDVAPRFPAPITESSPTIEEPDSTYGGLKASLERELLANGELRASILRPGAVHGPHSPKLREWYFIKRVLDSRQHVVLPRGGLAQFSTSSTANIAALIVACAATPGSRALNAVDDEPLTLAEKAEAVFRVMGHEAEIHTFNGAPTDELPADPWDTEHPFVCSMQLARDLVGYRPAVSYDEAIALDLEWLLPVLQRTEADGGSWHDLFPSVVSRYGAHGWYPYAAEDEWVRRSGG